MRNEKKVAFQNQRIAELEKQVRCLEAENKSIQQDIDRYKNIISSKDEVIETLRKEAFESKEQYQESLRDILELKANLRAAVSQIYDVRVKYEKEVTALINRIKKGK